MMRARIILTMGLLTATMLGWTERHASAGTLERKAWSIAAHSLLGNIVMLPAPAENGGFNSYLLAGAHQFRTMWARDFSMATAGALELGQYQTVRQSLEAFLRTQRPDGLVPRTIDNQDINARVILAILGFPPKFREPLKPWFETENGVISIDSNVCIPWAASQYVLRTHDLAFARRWFPAIEASFDFLEKNYFVDGLVGKQPPFSDWADSVKRTGRVSFTNVVYILALRGAAEWAQLLGLEEKAAYYSLRAAQTTAQFRDYFWLPRLGALRNFEGDDHLTADANLLAVAHHVTTPEQSLQIMKTMRASPIWQPMPGRNTWPNYPSSWKSFNVKFAGIASYHDAMYWLWITALAAQAERAVGNCVGYDLIMHDLSKRIVTDGTIYEVFDYKKRTGRLKPVWRLLYRAEHPFTWSSAYFLEAAAGGCHSN